MSKKTWFCLTIFFVILNVALLSKIYFFSNSTRSNDPNSVKAKVTEFNQKKYNPSTTSDTVLKFNSKLTNKIFSKGSPKKVKLLLIYPKDYCGACIDFSLPYVKNIYKKDPTDLVIVNPMQSYHLSTMISEKKLSQTHIKKVYLSGRKTESQFPVFLAVSSKGLIINRFTGRISSPERIQNFFKKVDFYLSINSN